MKSNQIIKTYSTEYKEMTKALLTAADLASHIQSSTLHIGIKPNLVSPTPASFGATTHPEIIAGIVEYLQEHGFFNITILEGSWVGDRTKDAYEICGYKEICETYNVSFFDTQSDSTFKQDCAGMSLHLCSKLKEIDFLINVPVLKGHCQTRVTCALKNMKGVIPNSEKRRFHSMGLHKPIAHLNTVIHQDFIVVDHICGDPDCEDGGNPLTTNCILVGTDPVLIDAYACRELHYECSDVAYLPLAANLGVGNMDLMQAEILNLKKNKSGEFIPEQSENGTASEKDTSTLARKFVNLHEMIDEVESCSACYANLIPALYRLQEDGLLDKLKEKICIGQGFRGHSGPINTLTPHTKSGSLGCGNCTADFAHYIPGCPPDEDAIYDYLRHYLNA